MPSNISFPRRSWRAINARKREWRSARVHSSSAARYDEADQERENRLISRREIAKMIPGHAFRALVKGRRFSICRRYRAANVLAIFRTMPVHANAGFNFIGQRDFFLPRRSNLLSCLCLSFLLCTYCVYTLALSGSRARSASHSRTSRRRNEAYLRGNAKAERCPHARFFSSRGRSPSRSGKKPSSSQVHHLPGHLRFSDTLDWISRGNAASGCEETGG